MTARTALLAASALFTLAACSYYWQQSAESDQVPVSFETAESEAVIAVDMVLASTDDEALDCGLLDYTFYLDGGDATLGTLDFSVFNGVDEAAVETGTIDLAENPFAELVRSTAWTESSDDACVAQIDVVLTSPDGAALDVLIKGVASDSSAGPDDNPGATELTVTADLVE